MQPFRHGPYPEQPNGGYYDRNWPRFDHPYPPMSQFYDFNQDYSRFMSGSPRFPEESFNMPSMINGYENHRMTNISAVSVAEAAAIDARNSSWVKSSPRMMPPFRMGDPYAHRPPYLETPARYAKYGGTYDYQPMMRPQPFPQMNNRLINPEMVPRPFYRQPSDLKRLISMGTEPDRPIFVNQLISLCDENEINITSLPVVSKQVIDLYILYKSVKELGGSLEVHKNKKWKDLAMILTGNSSTSTSYGIKRNYIKFILPYECKYDLNNADPLPIQHQLEPKRELTTPSRAGEDDDMSCLASPSTICSDGRFFPPPADIRPPQMVRTPIQVSSPVTAKPPVWPMKRVDSRQIMLSLLSDLPMHVFSALVHLGRISSQSGGISPDLSRMLVLTYNGTLFEVLLGCWLRSLRRIFAGEFGEFSEDCLINGSLPAMESIFGEINAEYGLRDPALAEFGGNDRVCQIVSQIFRNISFISVNQCPLAQNKVMVDILLRIMTFRGDGLHFPAKTSLFEDCLVILSNITVHLCPEVAGVLSKSLVFWITVDSSHVETSLMRDSPQALTPLRLSTECLLNLAANKKNIGIIVETLSFDQISRLFQVLAREIYTNDVVIRELNVSLLCLIFNNLSETEGARRKVTTHCFDDIVPSVLYFLDCCQGGEGESVVSEFSVCQAVDLLGSVLGDVGGGRRRYLRSMLWTRVAPLLRSEVLGVETRAKIEFLLFCVL